MNLDINFRTEEPHDFYAVEELTREAFWKFWESDRQICDEHFLVHKLRQSKDFVPELSCVAEFDGKLVGHIIYTKSRIVDENGISHEMLTFGPLSVLPEYQSMGIGKALMRHTFEIARQMGYRAVLIFGHPDYYPRVGFRRAAELGIIAFDGHSRDAFMAYPLYAGALDGISGQYFICDEYFDLSQEQVLEFDKKFPPKEKHTPIPIGVLLDRLTVDARAAIQSLGCDSLNMMTSKSEREVSALEGIDNTAIAAIRSVMNENGLRWGQG